MTIPVTENIVVYQGSTYVHEIPVTQDGVAVSLVGYTARMQIRSSKSSGTILYNSETDGDITIDTGTSTVTLEIPAATSDGWTWTSGVYDIELLDASSKPYRIMQGRVKVNKQVTR